MNKPKRSLGYLKKLAQSATTWRGHRMKWGQVFGRANGPKGQNASCIRCGMFVSILESPEPNQIDIGGEAVALNCPKVKERQI